MLADAVLHGYGPLQRVPKRQNRLVPKLEPTHATMESRNEWHFVWQQ